MTRTMPARTPRDGRRDDRAGYALRRAGEWGNAMTKPLLALFLFLVSGCVAAPDRDRAPVQGPYLGGGFGGH